MASFIMAAVHLTMGIGLYGCKTKRYSWGDLSPRQGAKALSYCQPQRGGGVKVLLRYFLTEKVTKRSCPLAGAMVRWDW